MKEKNKIIIYQDDNEVTRVLVRFADEDLWLTQNQLAEIYDTTQENISMHITSIYRDRELEQERAYKKFLLVLAEGSRQVKRNIDHYKILRNRGLLLNCTQNTICPPMKSPSSAQ